MLEDGWGPAVEFAGGGRGDLGIVIEAPLYYAANLYLNNVKVAELDLTLSKGDGE